MKHILLILALVSSPVFAGWDIGFHGGAVSSSSPVVSESEIAIDVGYGTDNLRVEVSALSGVGVKLGGKVGKWRLYAGANVHTAHRRDYVNILGKDVLGKGDGTLTGVFAEAQFNFEESDYVFLRLGQRQGNITYKARRFDTGTMVSGAKTTLVEDTVLWLGLRHYF